MQYKGTTKTDRFFRKPGECLRWMRRYCMDSVSWFPGKCHRWRLMWKLKIELWFRKCSCWKTQRQHEPLILFGVLDKFSNAISMVSVMLMKGWKLLLRMRSAGVANSMFHYPHKFPFASVGVTGVRKQQFPPLQYSSYTLFEVVAYNLGQKDIYLSAAQRAEQGKWTFSSMLEDASCQGEFKWHFKYGNHEILNTVNENRRNQHFQQVTEPRVGNFIALNGLKKREKKKKRDLSEMLAMLAAGEFSGIFFPANLDPVHSQWQLSIYLLFSVYRLADIRNRKTNSASNSIPPKQKHQTVEKKHAGHWTPAPHRHFFHAISGVFLSRPLIMLSGRLGRACVWWAIEMWRLLSAKCCPIDAGCSATHNINIHFAQQMHGEQSDEMRIR